MKLHKLVAVAVLALAVLVPVALVRAQVSSAEIPNLYIDDLKLERTTYAAGDTVKGTFKLVNDSDAIVSDAYYDIRFVGDFGNNGLPTTLYGTAANGPVALNPGEAKSLVLRYELPGAIAGKGLGIEVQARLKSGTPLGWADARLTVTGTSTPFTITKAQILVGDRSFGLGVGPTVYKNGTSTLAVTINNPGKASTTLHASVKIYSRSIVGQPIKTFAVDPFVVSGKGKKDVSIALPMFDYKPGVYVGVATFLNEKNAQVAPVVEFRYIVNGAIVTINSLSTTKQAVKAKEPFALNLFYSGSPYDIVTREALQSQPASLAVAVYNEMDEQVAKFSETMDFNSGSVKNIPLVASRDAAALRADITVTDSQGKLLTSYSTNLSTNYVSLHGSREKTGSSLLLYIILAVIILIGLIAFIFVRRTRSVAPYIGLFIFLVFFLGAPEKAHMAASECIATSPSTVVQCNATRKLEIYASIGIDVGAEYKQVKTVAPGQEYYIQGNVYSSACSNSFANLDFYAAGPVQNISEGPVTNGKLTCNFNTDTGCLNPTQVTGKVITWQINPRSQLQNTSHTITKMNTNFRPDKGNTFKAPSTPGTYYIYLRVTDLWEKNDGTLEPNGTIVIKVPVNVVAPSVTAAVVGADNSPASAPTGSKVQMDGTPGTAWKTNPTTFSNPTVSTHTFYATDPGPAYLKSVGTCTRSDTTQDCSPGTYISINGSCNGTYCTASAATGEDGDTKVVFKYELKPDFQATCGVSPLSITQGESATWTAYTIDAGPDIVYSWADKDMTTGEVGYLGSSASVSKTYVTPGQKMAYVVIATKGITKTINCLNSLIVMPPTPNLQVSCGPNPAAVNKNVSTTWTTYINNGGTNPTILWSNGVTGGANPVDMSYAAPGIIQPSVKVTTTGGQTATVACLPLIVTEPAPNLQVSCEPYPATRVITDAVAEVSVAWIAYIENSGAYPAIEWSGDVTGTENPIDQTYTTEGTKNASVTVTPVGKSPVTVACKPLTVNKVTTGCTTNCTPGGGELAPTVTLSAVSSTVNLGSRAYLRWETSNASHCDSVGFQTNGLLDSVTDVESDNELTGRTTFTLTCINVTKTASASVTVDVNTNPTDPTTDLACQPEVWEVQVGKPVKWLVTKGPLDVTYEWTGTSFVRVSGTNKKSVTAIYTTVGPKEMSVKANNKTAQCNTDATGKQFKVVADPNYKEF